MHTMTPLTTSDREALERDSWIDGATADRWGLSRVNSIEGAELVGRTDPEDYSGIVLPIYWPGQSGYREVFLRRDHPEYERRNGTLKPQRKYLAPPGRGNVLIFGPGESAASLTDASEPILLVEGLKKVMAAHRLTRWQGATPRFLACGLTGAWNFRGTIGKTTDATGARVSIKGIIPDLDRLTWTERMVYVLYDSDAMTNPSVAAAREALADELRRRGAHVITMFLPSLDNLDKTGFDDLCARWGPQAVLDWLQTAQSGAVESQDDPEPISLDAFDAPPVPPAVIPVPWLRDIVTACAASTETPIELPLLLMTGTIATAVQGKYAIAPEPGYVEPLNIWAIVTLESGARKTSVLREATAPLLEFEREQARMMAPIIASAESARRLSEERIKHLRQKAAKADGLDRDVLRHELLEEEAALPIIPKSCRLWGQDVTAEQLGSLMAEHNERMSIISDEGGIFELLGGRYSNGIPNLDLFLQAYSGSPVRVDRSSRPAVYLKQPALTLILSPQPTVLQSLAAVPSFRGRGLLARPLYALPKSPIGYRTLVSNPIPDPIRQAYGAGIMSLLSLPPPPDGESLHALRFADDSLIEWKGFQAHVETEMRDGRAFEHLRDWASKLPGNVARIAGLFHMALHVDGHPEDHPIDLSTTEAALALGGIFERHALAVFSLMAVDSTLDASRKIWAWVVRGQHSTFSKRECFKGVQSVAFPDVASVEAALHVLIERSFLFPLTHVSRPGRPSPGFRVNQRFTKEWQPCPGESTS